MSMSWEEYANENHNLKAIYINFAWPYFLKTKTTSTNELMAD